ncbi:MAG TPA: phosphotransferase [Acidimicrobiales bacterium]
MSASGPRPHPRAGGPDEVRRTPQDVEPAWLTTVLRGRDLLTDGRVTSVTPTPVGTGQMADTVRFALTYEPAGAGPPTIVGKFASQDEQSHATGKVMRAYEVEVRFYAEIAPRVTSRHPGLLFAAVDPDEAWFTLLLEDLSEATQGDEIAGCDVDVAAAALGQLAGLHAPCWEAPDLAASPWVNRATPESDAFTASIVTGVFPGFLERYGDRVAPAHVRLLQSFLPRLGPWMARPRGPRTLVHADFRLDNLLFTPDDPAPVVVDYQTVNWGSGAYDLAYFVGGCLEPEVRRPAAESLVAGYHEALATGGVRDYPLEDLVTDYRRECFGGLMMAVAASMLVKQTERGDAMFLTSVRRHAQQSIDLDALDLLADE